MRVQGKLVAVKRVRGSTLAMDDQHAISEFTKEMKVQTGVIMDLFSCPPSILTLHHAVSTQPAPSQHCLLLRGG